MTAAPAASTLPSSSDRFARLAPGALGGPERARSLARCAGSVVLALAMSAGSALAQPPAEPPPASSPPPAQAEPQAQPQSQPQAQPQPQPAGERPAEAGGQSAQPAGTAQPAGGSQPAGDQAQPDEPGRETELTLRDRQTVRGRLIRVTREVIVLAINGVETNFPVDQVAQVRRLPSVEERYAALREAIPDDDVEGLLRLAQWLQERGRPRLALDEVNRALAAQPNHQQAMALQRVLEAQIRVEESRAARPPRAEEPVRQLPVGPRPGLAPLPQDPRDAFPLLTPEQINIIRLLEVDLRDPPRMIIRRATVERFLDKYGGQVVQGRGIVPVTPEAREQFLRRPAPEVLSWFFDLRAREFYPEVEITENPRSMQTFRDRVHSTWLVNGCSTTKCHGGEEAGRLYLYNRNQRSDASAYTNFLILDRFRTSQGVPLIDYQEPARSPLLQMGLPRDKAVFRHPGVQGSGRRWQPVFDSEDDRRFQEAVRWIRSMYPNRSDYPIDYTPPVPGALRGVQGPRGILPGENDAGGSPQPGAAAPLPAPGSAVPEQAPAQPAPVQPDPSQPAPGQPDPVQPDPARPTSEPAPQSAPPTGEDPR